MSRFIPGTPSSPGQEGGEKSESHEVTAEVLTKILSSQEFSKVLKQVDQSSLNTFHETGFSVGFSSVPEIGKAFGSGEGSIAIEDQSRAINSEWGQLSLGDHYWETGVQLIVDAHVHPGSSVEPSQADLEAIFETRKFMLGVARHDVYPIMAIIAHPGGYSGQEVAVLLIQEKPNSMPPTKAKGQMINNLKENLLMERFGPNRTEINPEETLGLLQKIPGLNAALIIYKYTGSGVDKKLNPLQSQEEIAARLKNFTFRPKQISKSE